MSEFADDVDDEEVAEGVVDFFADFPVEDDVEGLFAHGQHEIFGIAHDGGPGGVGSGRGRGEGGNLSWRRDLERDERAGTKRNPSS
jgi:hypothetical protein